MLPTLLICIVIFIVILKFKLRAIEQKEAQEEAEFLALEQKASLPVKRDMNDLSFFTIPLDTLPFLTNTDKELQKIQDEVRKLSTKKICSLSNMSNTDLKLKYGAGNLKELSEYDQNYTTLLRTLADWGLCLYKHGYLKEAELVCEYAKACGSDIRNTYITLARIYKEQNRIEEIYSLLKFVEPITTMLDLKKAIYDVLNEY